MRPRKMTPSGRQAKAPVLSWREDVDPESVEFNMIRAMVLADVRSARVVSVQRVHNRAQYRRFVSERENMRDVMGGDAPEERFLWHGTR